MARQDSQGDFYFTAVDCNEKWQNRTFCITYDLGTGVKIIVNKETGERRFLHGQDQGYVFARNEEKNNETLFLRFYEIIQGTSKKGGKRKGTWRFKQNHMISFGGRCSLPLCFAPYRSYFEEVKINPEEAALAALNALDLREEK